ANEMNDTRDKERHKNYLADDGGVFEEHRLGDGNDQGRNEKSNGGEDYLLQSHRLASFLGDHPVDDLIVAVLVNELAPAAGVRIGRSKDRIAVQGIGLARFEKAAIVGRTVFRIAEDLVGFGDSGKGTGS